MDQPKFKLAWHLFSKTYSERMYEKSTTRQGAITILEVSDPIDCSQTPNLNHLVSFALVYLYLCKMKILSEFTFFLFVSVIHALVLRIYSWFFS